MKQKTKSSNHMHRMFTIAKIFLACTPIIAYFYVSMMSSSMQLTFQEVLTQNPSITIVFLIAMMNPYIAYLLNLVEKKLENQDTAFACINMILLLIAQLLTLNVFYFVMLLFVFYKAMHYYQIDIKSTIQSMNIKQSLWNGGGSFLVMMVSSVCLFATMRLM